MTKPRLMPCMDGCGLQWFQPNGDTAGGKPDYTCPRCGFMQTSSPAGAAELCECATWWSQEAYDAMARIARSAGHEVPETPPYFDFEMEQSE